MPELYELLSKHGFVIKRDSMGHLGYVAKIPKDIINEFLVNKEAYGVNTAIRSLKKELKERAGNPKNFSMEWFSVI